MVTTTHDDGSTSQHNDDGSGSFTGADGSSATYDADGGGSYTGADGSTGTYDADGVDPILMQMVPLVLILQMDQVLTPKPMVVLSVWMPRATEAMKVQMAHPVL